MNEKEEYIGRGRPRTYTPSMCDTIIGVAAQGGHVAAMCLAIGIRSRDTWYRWKDEYPEFREATEYAELVSQAYYEGIGGKAIKGEIPNFNFNAYAIVMNNKFPNEYRRSANSASTEINIGSINSIEKMDPGILDKKIAALTHKLSLVAQKEESDESTD